jgi:hypothetical protein
MKKILLLILGILTVYSLTGCSKPFVFPTESDFSLVANVSKTNPMIGEEIEVAAEFQNLSDSSYKTTSGNDLIDVKVFDLIENPEKLSIDTGPVQSSEMKAKQEIKKSHTVKFDKAGMYEIQVVADFQISNNKTDEQKNFRLKVEPIIIEVK